MTTADSSPSIADLLRRLLALTDRASRRRFALVLILALANGIAEIGAALLVVGLIQIVAGGELGDVPLLANARDLAGDLGDREFTVLFCAFVAVFYLLKNLLVAGHTALSARAANLAAASLAVRLLRGYLYLPYAIHAQRNSSEVIRTITTSNDIVVRMALVAAVSLLSDTFVLIAILGILLVQEPLVAPISGLLLGGLLWAAYQLLRHRLERIGEATNTLAARKLQEIQQGLGAVREIQVLGRQPFFAHRYERSRYTVAGLQWRYDTYSQLPRLAFETIFVVSLAAIVAVVAIRSGTDGEAIPVLGLFAYAGFRLLPSVNRVIQALTTLRYSTAGVAEVQREIALVDRVPDVPTRQEPVAREFGELVFDGVGYRYEGRSDWAVRDVHLSLCRGESLGLVGATGSGKSTVLDLLVGLLRPTEGEIRLDGSDIWTALREWQDQIGYVGQVPYLIDDSLRRNIALGVDDDAIDEDAVEQAVAAAQLDDVLALLPDGMDTMFGEHGARLSGGQRQRIAIARALYRDPPVLVLDEATSSLDYETEQAVTAAINELSGVKTLVIVAHRLASVRACDSLLFLRAGRVVATGSYSELMQQEPLFAQLVESGSPS